MKKILSFTTILFLACVLASFLFATGLVEGSANEKNTLGDSPQTPQESSEKIAAADLHSRPDIILESYRRAYPEIIKTVVQKDGDWAVELYSGTFFYWANGRLLTEEKKDTWEEYRAYQIWAYRGDPRDPSTYTEEYIDGLRNRTSSDVRGAPQLPQDTDFFQALFGVGTRGETEESLVKAGLFGKTVNVNKVVASTFDSINAEVEELAKTDAEVKEFLDTLSEASGYSWRTVAGTNRLSNHSYGLAIDVLPRGWGNKMMYWAWVRDYNDDWMLVPQEDLWTPPEKVVQIMLNNGFIWGGTWAIYDTMHFEYKPELIEISKRVIFD